MTDAERAGAVAAAGRDLATGGLVILPTETVYGIFASLRSVEAVTRLEALTLPKGPGATGIRFAWHAGSMDDVLGVLSLSSRLHERLVRGLNPGPVRFRVELGADGVSRTCGRLGIPTGLIDNGSDIAFRVVRHEAASGAIRASGAPAVAQRLAAAGWGPDRDVSAALRDGRAERAGIVSVLDDGATQYGRASTSVVLRRDGSYEVESVGAVEERFVDRQAEVRVFFVCTGNTCRSPMAAAIAQSLVEERGTPGVRVVVSSAGTSASAGAPASTETVEALRSVGVEAAPHRSRQLTRQALADADVVFAMTRWHVDDVLALDPGAGDRVQLLDASGEDVPDPVGLSQEVYNRTAERLRRLVAARLEALGVLTEDRG